MGIPDYLLLALSIAGSYAVGLCFIKSGPIQTCVVGVFTQALLLGATVWWIPNLSVSLVGTVQCFAGLVVVSQKQDVLRAHRLVAFESIKRANLYITLIAASLVSLPFALHEYPFNSHDPVYWGYTLEALTANYAGPLRSPTLQPLELAVTHLLPMMSLVTLAAYVPDPDLLTVIGIKHLVTIAFFWRLSWYLLSDLKLKDYLFGSMLLTGLFFFFESELGYNFLISSFAFEILLLELCISLRTRDAQPDSFLIILLCLAAARGPLAYAALGAFAFMCISRPKVTPGVLLIATLLVGNILTWITRPKPFNFFCDEATLSFENPISLHQANILKDLSEWTLPNSLTSLLYRALDNLKENFVIAEANEPVWVSAIFLLYVSAKFFAPILIWLRAKYHESEAPWPIRKTLWIYLSLLWLGMLVLRIGGSAEHQFHAFLVLSVMALLALFKVGLSNKLAGSLIIALGIHAASFDGFTGRPFSAILSQGIASEHLRYLPNETWSTPEQQRLWHDEVKLMALGSSRPVTALTPEQYSTYFDQEPPDRETISSVWVIPNSTTMHLCQTRITD